MDHEVNEFTGRIPKGFDNDDLKRTLTAFHDKLAYAFLSSLT